MPYADEMKENKIEVRTPRMTTLTYMKYVSWYIGSDTAIRRLSRTLVSNAVNG